MPDQVPPVPSQPPRSEPPPPTAKKKKSWLVRILLTLGIVVVALVLLVLFVAPPIAASIATGKIKEGFGRTLNGDLLIGPVWEGWVDGIALHRIDPHYAASGRP